MKRSLANFPVTGMLTWSVWQGRIAMALGVVWESESAVSFDQAGECSAVSLLRFWKNTNAKALTPTPY